MASLPRGIGSLLRDPKYSDLEIRCDGWSYYVHRAIVCSRSLILARQCDGDSEQAHDGIIECTTFDALTLERMLQFVYEGDYTITAASLEAAGEAQTMTAHVLVYAIAESYEIPDLQALALTRFTHCDETLGTDDFLQLARVLYVKTTADEIRKELLSRLLTHHAQWLADENFTSVLANDGDLHEFAVAVMTAVFAKSVEYDRSEKAKQAAASKLLLADLDQANEGLAKSVKRVRGLDVQVNDLQADVGRLKSNNFKLDGELRRCRGEKESLVTASDLMQADLDQVNEGLARSTGRVKALEGQVANLHSQISDKQRANVLALSDVKSELTKETARANKNYDLCNQKVATIKTETARANSNYDICNQKDKIIKEKDAVILSEKARADRGLSIIKSLVCLVNDTDGCRSCGGDLNFRLQPDDRTGTIVKPFNSMLRCHNCKTKEYGDLIR